MTYSKTVVLPVTPDEAFALITEPERLRRWMTVTAYVDLRAGGDYRWTVSPGHRAGGTVREVEPGRRVVLGWGWVGDATPDVDGSTVILTVEPDDNGSRVTLVHEGLTPEEEAGHAEGWAHFLERLEAAGATGDAGQDPWHWAPKDLTPVVAAEAALAAIQPVLRAITDADAERRTPCPELPVGLLVDHLETSMAGLGAMAGATVERTEGSAEHRVSTVAAQTITAWHAIDPDGTVEGPVGEMPASVAAALLSAEILLHGWDLAEAMGLTVRVSDEVVGYIRGLSEPILPTARGRSFADEVPAAADAPPLDRFAAFAGRPKPVPVAG
ncbi:TIGR03086 family metal-binding protein [Nocardioides bizhenqiangii]|uniref:TIGR03086 family metal-binding protein n=1 Tax=Nocardioides bizhenqiangii TaxID=3095076 RepID=A0ABZ0ZW19_9ACTN|nr:MULTISPECIES: TIGR03086 family metal-binding protein [unclassified Nocardioides]MDZ5622301.1 TIGR03086 family metal-binding protein [Nocardioides sp. HM23]WQQ28526.1 TIGR03086 family metal-binding protein [Nocardioides sp. HM61]